MFKTLRFKKGFTMVEVIVAAIIFSLAAAGIYATINALSRPAEEASRDVAAAFLAKRILEDLRSNVTAEAWDAAAWSDGNHPLPDRNIDGISYHVNYLVLTDAVGGREVNVTISW